MQKSWDTGAIVAAVVSVVVAGLPALFFKFSDGKSHVIINLCNPKGVIQAHAIWHVMSALLVLVVYDFFAHYSGDGRIFVNWLADD